MELYRFQTDHHQGHENLELPGRLSLGFLGGAQEREFPRKVWGCYYWHPTRPSAWLNEGIHQGTDCHNTQAHAQSLHV
jgi:hypothetical protein